MKAIKVVLPMPPSSNNIYVKKPKGGMTKSTEARSWERRALQTIVRDNNLGLQSEFDREAMYWLDLTFYFEEITNKGWHERWKKGAKKGQRKAENKWKKIDLSNRIKLLEDTVRKAVGVDDSATMELSLHKRCSPDNPRVEIEFCTIEEEDIWLFES